MQSEREQMALFNRYMVVLRSLDVASAKYQRARAVGRNLSPYRARILRLGARRIQLASLLEDNFPERFTFDEDGYLLHADFGGMGGPGRRRMESLVYDALHCGPQPYGSSSCY